MFAFYCCFFKNKSTSALNRASNSFADIYITIFNTEKSLLVYFAQPKKQNEYFLLSAIEKTTFVFQHGWHVKIKVLMYWNPDFFMCSCAYYVWLWMRFPSLSYSSHLSLFPFFSSSKCNCWKVKKNHNSLWVNVSATYNSTVQLQYINCVCWCWCSIHLMFTKRQIVTQFF